MKMTNVDTVQTFMQTGITTDLSGDSTPQLGGFLDANGNYMQTEKGGDIASASPTVIDTDGDYFDVTGTTGFSAFTVAADRQFTLQFDGALTMTHHATNLDLPGEANITTAAGDVATFQSTAANQVQCISYTKADGTAVTSSGTITALNSATENEVVTVGNTTTELDAEANLTFDGNNLSIGGASPAERLHVKGSAPGVTIESDTNSTSRTWRFKTETVAGGDLAFQYGTTLAGTPSQTSIRFTNDGRGLSEFTAKAWADFDQATVNASHNVTSVTDNGTGNYSINFTNNMDSANYAPCGMGETAANVSNWSSGTSASALNIRTDNSASGAYTDYPAAIIVFGD
jgi:hypothetical protein